MEFLQGCGKWRWQGRKKWGGMCLPHARYFYENMSTLCGINYAWWIYRMKTSVKNNFKVVGLRAWLSAEHLCANMRAEPMSLAPMWSLGMLMGVCNPSMVRKRQEDPGATFPDTLTNLGSILREFDKRHSMIKQKSTSKMGSHLNSRTSTHPEAPSNSPLK